MKSKIWVATGFVLFATIFFIGGIATRQQYEKNKNRARYVEDPMSLSSDRIVNVEIAFPELPISRETLTIGVYNGTDWHLTDLTIHVNASGNEGDQQIDRRYRLADRFSSLTTRSIGLNAPELMGATKLSIKVESANGFPFEPGKRF